MNSNSAGLAARRRAHEILIAVLNRRQPLDTVLEQDQEFLCLQARDRGFVRNLVATTLRRLGQIDAIVASKVQRPLPESAVAARNALRLGICQLLFLGTPSHAAAYTSVALSKQGPRRFVGLVNAVLRQVAKEPSEDLKRRFPVGLNTPAWLMDSWVSAYGKETAHRIGCSHQNAPPLDITVKEDPVGWARRLGGTHIWGETVRLPAAGIVSSLPGYEEGAWWVQDLAATLPARLLMASSGIDAGTQVCDLCAAPGGKTAQLAAAGLEVEAVDNSAFRLRLMRGNFRRLSLKANIVERDAAGERPGRVFDAVLLDAPCTSTGTIRRHPDIPWLKTPDDVARLSVVQKKLLHAAIGLAAPMAPIVYSVCSLERDECEDVVDAVVGERSDVVRNPFTLKESEGAPVTVTSSGDIRTLPCELAEAGGMDGFFISRMRKVSRT